MGFPWLLRLLFYETGPHREALQQGRDNIAKELEEHEKAKEEFSESIRDLSRRTLQLIEATSPPKRPESPKR